MNRIDALARILTAEGQPAAGQVVRLEAFELAGGWKAIGEGKADADGQVRISAEPTGQGHVYAPALRLVEPGDPAARILAEGGAVTFQTVRGRVIVAQPRPTPAPSIQVLTVDFGEVERLEETAHARRAADGNAAVGLTIAGQPRRGEVTGAMMVRAIGAVNPQALGGVTDRARAVALGEAARKRLLGDAAAATPAARVEAPVVTERFNAELLQFMGRETALRADLRAKVLEAEEAQVKVVGLERNIAEIAARLAATERERAAAAEEAATLRAAAAQEAPVQAIAASIGTEAEAANQALAGSGANWRIGRLQVTLRGTLSGAGTRITLPDAATVRRPGAVGALQDVTFDLLPERRPTAPAAGTKVPDVRGMTESAARRALAGAGFALSAATRPGWTGEGFSIGQAIQQAPAAGAEAQPGESVVVVFAAP
jgi:hypothetical protein